MHLTALPELDGSFIEVTLRFCMRPGGHFVQFLCTWNMHMSLWSDVETSGYVRAVHPHIVKF